MDSRVRNLYTKLKGQSQEKPLDRVKGTVAGEPLQRVKGTVAGEKYYQRSYSTVQKVIQISAI